MRRTLKIIGCLLIPAAMAACAAKELATPVSIDSTEASLVAAGLARLPSVQERGEIITRPFFATIHMAGRRMTASGVLEYAEPRNFRIIAATEMGAVLFDGRVNWAGVTVLRQLPGIDKRIVESMLADMTQAFEMPAGLEGLSTGGDKLELRRRLGDARWHTWNFDALTGRLRSTDVEMGIIDTLHVEFRSYDARGWPEEFVVARRARFYAVSLTFTDSHVVVQSEAHGNAQ